MQFVTKLWREPLLHFVVIGVALFAATALWESGADRGDDTDRIQVTAVEIKWLQESFQARWQRPPTATELRGLVDNFVRQEVLYREALAVGLDRNDEIIRRRMVQKLEFMTEDLATQQTPTEAELKSYLQENLDRYRIPEQRRFEQIYFNVDRRGDDSEGAAGGGRAAKELLAKLRSPDAPEDTAELGDRFLLEYDDRPQSRVEVERLFGQRFAAALFDLDAGAWHGPVPSGYGIHLVRVTEVAQGAAPELAAVRDEVLRDYGATMKQRVKDETYSMLSDRYEIEIDEEAIRALSLAEPSGKGAR